MDLDSDKIQWAVIAVIVLVASTAVHEFGHAFAADWLGDDTPRRQGRVTLNPIAHTDPIGTLLVPLIGGLYAAGGGIGGGFGWGRPVQWQPSRIHRKWKMTTAQILVAIAGPLMNVLLAVLVAGVHTLLYKQGVIPGGSKLNMVLQFTVFTNFILFFFNLVPVPPLDGGHVLQGLLPYRYRGSFDSFARFGPFIVMAFVLIPQFRFIFQYPATLCFTHLYQLFGLG